MSDEQLYRNDLLARLVRLNQKASEDTKLKREEQFVAGLIGRAIELLPISHDVDILPYLPQIVHQALASVRQTCDEAFQRLLHGFEQYARFSFPNFDTLEVSEEACDVSLLMIERVIVAATGNEFIAADVKAALRAPRYVAERHGTSFCYSSVGREVLRLGADNRAGGFGNTLLRTERREEDMILLFSDGAECDFAFAWDGAGATFCFARGDVTEQRIIQLLADVYRHWRPEHFIAFEL